MRVQNGTCNSREENKLTRASGEAARVRYTRCHPLQVPSCRTRFALVLSKYCQGTQQRGIRRDYSVYRAGCTSLLVLRMSHRLCRFVHLGSAHLCSVVYPRWPEAGWGLPAPAEERTIWPSGHDQETSSGSCRIDGDTVFCSMFQIFFRLEMLVPCVVEAKMRFVLGYAISFG